MENLTDKEMNYLDKETVEFDKVLLAIKKNKIFLISCILFFSLAFSAFSFSVEDKYKSDALMQTSNDVSSSKNTGYGALASIAGISIGNSSEADKSILAIEVLKSRDFLKHIVKNPKVFKTLSVDSFENFAKFHKNFNRNIFSLNKNKNTGYITISVTHQDPIFAKELLELIVAELNFLQKEKDLKESTNALSYLNAQYASKTLTNIKDSINKLVEEQLQTQMLLNIKKDYIFSYIDKPNLPIEKDSPIRAIYLILGLFFGISIGIVYIFSLEFFQKGQQ